MESVSNPLYKDISPHADGRKYERGDWRKIPEIIHDEHQIKGFFGKYRWLSNFGAAHVVVDDVTYGSVERAYQAMKWRPEDRAYFETCTDEEAITYNRQHQPNGHSAEEWDEMRICVMRFLLEQKFDPKLNPDNARKLLETGDRYLEETNWWNDTFWGKNLQGEGENHLGELLMEIRTALRELPTSDNVVL